jgi:hypothetical protein
MRRVALLLSVLLLISIFIVSANVQTNAEKAFDYVKEVGKEGMEKVKETIKEAKEKIGGGNTERHKMDVAMDGMHGEEIKVDYNKMSPNDENYEPPKSPVDAGKYH